MTVKFNYYLRMKEKLLRKYRLFKRAATNYEYHKWVLSDGDKNLLLNLELDENSIFFELGGFDGTYSKQVLDKYSPITYVFEPSKEYYDYLNSVLKGPNVKVVNKGLSNFNGVLFLVNIGDKSFTTDSLHENAEKIEVIKLSEYMENNNIKKIDLININVEGAEYEILDDLINSEKIKDIHNIHIQFHKNKKKYKKLRKNLQLKLSNTHKQTWNYNYVWEKWEKVI
tara:strand:- start:3529 stop:4206 length:678 start_codon:yes stop_codon:yes gene_type:complete